MLIKGLLTLFVALFFFSGAALGADKEAQKEEKKVEQTKGEKTKDEESKADQEPVKVSKDWLNSAWKRIGSLTEKQRSYEVQKTRTVAGVRGKEATDEVIEKLYYKGGERAPTRAELKSAIELLEKTIAEDPKDSQVPEARYFLAQCHLQLGNMQEALNIYNEISKKHPKSKWAKRAKAEGERLMEEMEKEKTKKK